MRILWNYLTLLLYCCLFFTIALLGVGLVVSLFFLSKMSFFISNQSNKKGCLFWCYYRVNCMGWDCFSKLIARYKSRKTPPDSE